uniref:Uncharacterized protein n=1 Tax=Arundo donax TaxID=35708 RepID=A0A0A9AT76_ARUDO
MRRLLSHLIKQLPVFTKGSVIAQIEVHLMLMLMQCTLTEIYCRNFD